MKIIVQQFGEIFLEIIGVVAVFGIYMSFFQPGGILNTAIQSFLQTICG